MSSYYERIFRPVLFQKDSEAAHEWGVHAMALLGRAPRVAGWLAAAGGRSGRAQTIEVFGLQFPNRIGLAAGFDKNGVAWPAAAALGFGHVEIGTITAEPQPGNPRPRMFRYPEEEAIINRMGFNNEGAHAVAQRLARMPGPGRRKIPLGINLGKSKITDLEAATADYLRSFGALADYADYIVLNVSSPNTPGLRQLQDEGRLRELLAAISNASEARPIHGKKAVPLLLKIAPDLTFGQIDAVLQAVSDFRMAGIIATNTTLARPGVWAEANETGGLSGAPLRQRSTEIVRYIYRVTLGRLPIVGVGGITDTESAAEKLDAGATLIQIYTGMIYRGPFFARQLAWALADRK